MSAKDIIALIAYEHNMRQFSHATLKYMNLLYPHPSSHRELRALLRTIERAYEQKDNDALQDAYDLAVALVKNENDEVVEYISGLSERLRNDYTGHYCMYTDEDIAAMKEPLDRQAYGDFNEAMLALQYDLQSIDRYASESDIEARIFKPEYFNNEDRAKWTELYGVANTLLHETKVTIGDNSVARAVSKLRDYQQRSYGPLVPTITASYRRDDEGFSISVTWLDNEIVIAPYSPFHDELNKYFDEHPVTAPDNFTPKCLPKSINGYELRTTSCAKVFRYEL